LLPDLWFDITACIKVTSLTYSFTYSLTPSFAHSVHSFMYSSPILIHPHPFLFTHFLTF
jgi:hypothetical protein